MTRSDIFKIIGAMTAATIVIGGSIYIVSDFFAARSAIHLDAFATIFSTIAGGALAFGGVWWTIMDQNRQRQEELERRDRENMEELERRNKERKEELAIQYKPILELAGMLETYAEMYYRKLNFVRSFRLSNSCTKKYEELVKTGSTIELVFKLSNVGRGCLANTKIIEYSIKKADIFNECILDWKGNMSFVDLTPGSTSALVLCIPEILQIKNEFLSDKPIRETIKAVIRYTDEFNVHEYELTIYFMLLITPIVINTDYNEEGTTLIIPEVDIDQAMPVLKVIC